MQCCAVFGLPFLSIVSLRIDKKFADRLLALQRVCVAALALLCVLSLGRSYLLLKSSDSLTLNLKDYPVNAVSFLADSNESGDLLVDFNTGGYALWRLYPKFRISMDGRYETVYTESTHEINQAAFAIGSDHGLKAFKQINPSHAMLPNAEYMRENVLRLGDKWRVVFSDERNLVAAGR